MTIKEQQIQEAKEQGYSVPVIKKAIEIMEKTKNMTILEFIDMSLKKAIDKNLKGKKMTKEKIIKEVEEIKESFIFWSDYASDYFKEKHNLEKYIKNIEEFIERLKND